MAAEVTHDADGVITENESRSADAAADAASVSTLRSLLVSYPDWPRPGVVFLDIFPIFRSPEAASMLFELFARRLRRLRPTVEVVTGLEARGLLIAAAVAPRVQAACVPVRKRGKLPGATRSSGYEKEYGADALEIQADAIRAGARCVVIDDLVATGGSLRAAVSLVRDCGGVVVECCVLIRLTELRQQQQQVRAPVFSFIDC